MYRNEIAREAHIMGTMEALRRLSVGDNVVLCQIERPNIYKLAGKAFRRVKVKKQDDGCFLVTCTAIYGDSGELVLPER